MKPYHPKWAGFNAHAAPYALFLVNEHDFRLRIAYNRIRRTNLRARWVGTLHACDRLVKRWLHSFDSEARFFGVQRVLTDECAVELAYPTPRALHYITVQVRHASTSLLINLKHVLILAHSLEDMQYVLALLFQKLFAIQHLLDALHRRLEHNGLHTLSLHKPSVALEVAPLEQAPLEV